MSRFISNTTIQQDQMLKEIGLGTVEDLFNDIPQEVRLSRKLTLPEALSEYELLNHTKNLSRKNINLDDHVCFLGAGAYDHYIPSAVDALLSRQEFYTAYTPYQPEISQGMLQAIFEFQTMICELTGMDIANASMYDGASALAEAMLLACQSQKRQEVLVAKSVHPESREILKTYAKFRGLNVREVGYLDGQLDIKELKEMMSSDTAAIMVQNPNFFGSIESLEEIGEIARNNKSLFIVSSDPISLGLLKSPGELGADIVVGEGQSMGNPLNFGGPYLGFFAAREKLLRKVPGRIVGQTTDKRGNRSFTLTIQTREQHIRREKATSNICSNQALNALAATIYLTLLGKQGLKEVALLSLEKAHYAFDQLTAKNGFSPIFKSPFFKEFVVQSTVPPEELNKKLLDQKIIGGYPLQQAYPEMTNGWLIAVTEKRTKDEIDSFVLKAGGQ